MPFTVEVEAGRHLRFKAWGATIEPKSARWKAATPKQKGRYYAIFASILDEAWGAQMLEGVGRRGKLRKPHAISRLAYRQAGLESTGPALLPRRERSRAYRHRKVTAYSDLGRVTGYYGYGTGRWLSYHHEGLSGRGRHYFDDRGRIRWSGIKGQVTGVVRDLMPTAATIAAAVADAEREWAIAVGAGRRRTSTPTPTPRPGVVVPPPVPRPGVAAIRTPATRAKPAPAASVPVAPPAPPPETPLQRHRRLIAEAEARQGGRIPGGPIADRIARYEVGEAKLAAIRELIGDPIREVDRRLDAAAAAAREAFAEVARVAADAQSGRIDPARVAAELARAERGHQAARRDLAGIEARRQALAAESRSRFLEVVGVADGVRVAAAPGTAVNRDGARLLPPDEAVRGRVAEAESFLRAVVRPGDTPTVGDGIAVGVVPPGRPQRAQFSGDGRYVQVTPDVATATVVHEFGHLLEEALVTDGVRLVDRAREYFEHRTAGRPVVRLRDVMPDGAAYREDEVARDGFAAQHGPEGWYMGKDYGPDGTEITSMALERLYRDPADFVRRDPEYARLILGLLDGSLR